MPEGSFPIETDTYCRHCGYNLRGLAPTDRCPECDFSIADSLDLSSHLRSKAKACWLLVAAMVLMVQALPWLRGWGVWGMLYMVANAVLLVALAVGVWWFTRATSPGEPLSIARRVARLAAVVLALVEFLTPFFVLLIGNYMVATPVQIVVFPLLLVCRGLGFTATLALSIALGRYLSTLAEEFLQRPLLARVCRWVIPLFGIGLGLCMALQLLLRNDLLPTRDLFFLVDWRMVLRGMSQLTYLLGIWALILCVCFAVLLPQARQKNRNANS